MGFEVWLSSGARTEGRYCTQGSKAGMNFYFLWFIYFPLQFFRFTLNLFLTDWLLKTNNFYVT